VTFSKKEEMPTGFIIFFAPYKEAITLASVVAELPVEGQHKLII